MNAPSLDIKHEKSEKSFSISHILSLPEKLGSDGDGRMSSGSQEDVLSTDSTSRDEEIKPMANWMLSNGQPHSDSESIQTEAGKSTI